ncbi:unnamed protein product [Medioppia subpectinata]|uniref:Uncharacterized protein n=1 Tax=Medioppia subpectinata TaxID=1979941 RepID=A0A7R9Q0M6_9ACAR|nr:unnamed protein product [Medioppia subpectinata]CAG2108252.1 unnamed protein product [Medioppia subpectinata]
MHSLRQNGCNVVAMDCRRRSDVCVRFNEIIGLFVDHYGFESVLVLICDLNSDVFSAIRSAKRKEVSVLLIYGNTSDQLLVSAVDRDVYRFDDVFGFNVKTTDSVVDNSWPAMDDSINEFCRQFDYKIGFNSRDYREVEYNNINDSQMSKSQLRSCVQHLRSFINDHMSDTCLEYEFICICHSIQSNHSMIESLRQNGCNVVAMDCRRRSDVSVRFNEIIGLFVDHYGFESVLVLICDLNSDVFSAIRSAKRKEVSVLLIYGNTSDQLLVSAVDRDVYRFDDVFGFNVKTTDSVVDNSWPVMDDSINEFCRQFDYKIGFNSRDYREVEYNNINDSQMSKSQLRGIDVVDHRLNAAMVEMEFADNPINNSLVMCGNSSTTHLRPLSPIEVQIDDKCKSVIIGLYTKANDNVLQLVRDFVKSWREPTLDESVVLSVNREKEFIGRSGRASLIVTAIDAKTNNKILNVAKKCFTSRVERIYWNQLRRSQKDRPKVCKEQCMSLVIGLWSRHNENVLNTIRQLVKSWHLIDFDVNHIVCVDRAKRFKGRDGKAALIVYTDSVNSLYTKANDNVLQLVRDFVKSWREPTLDESVILSVNREKEFIGRSGRASLIVTTIDAKTNNKILNVAKKCFTSRVERIYWNQLRRSQKDRPKVCKEQCMSLVIGLWSRSNDNVLNTIRQLVKSWHLIDFDVNHIVCVDRAKRFKGRDGKAALIVYTDSVDIIDVCDQNYIWIRILTEMRLYPILLQNGLAGNTEQWFITRPGLLYTNGTYIENNGLINDCLSRGSVANTLPFVLSACGYDVWLENLRGNYRYWSFNLDQYSSYDLTANIKYILDTTKSKTLGYIGFSLGNTIMFQLLASQPQYSLIIKPFISLASFVYLENIRSPLLRLTDVFEPLFRFILLRQKQSESEASVKNNPLLADIFASVCILIYFLIGGFDLENLDKVKLGAHFPDSLSSIVLAHVGQRIHFNTFNDDLLRSQLTVNPYADYVVPFNGWTHGDFLYANSVGRYIPILTGIRVNSSDLEHGFFQNSDNWLISSVGVLDGNGVYSEDNSIVNNCFDSDSVANTLPFVLSSCGYDVWLGNIRGNSSDPKPLARLGSLSPLIGRHKLPDCLHTFLTAAQR